MQQVDSITSPDEHLISFDFLLVSFCHLRLHVIVIVMCVIIVMTTTTTMMMIVFLFLTFFTADFHSVVTTFPLLSHHMHYWFLFHFPSTLWHLHCRLSMRYKLPNELCLFNLRSQLCWYRLGCFHISYHSTFLYLHFTHLCKARLLYHFEYRHCYLCHVRTCKLPFYLRLHMMR